MALEFTRGDQFPVNFRVVDENQKVILADDINEITLTCRKSPYKTSSILFQKKKSDKTIYFNENLEEWEFKILEKDTKDLSYGEYGFDIEIVIGDLIISKVGKINITNEYTMEENSAN